MTASTTDPLATAFDPSAMAGDRSDPRILCPLASTLFPSRLHRGTEGAARHNVRPTEGERPLLIHAWAYSCFHRPEEAVD